MDKPFTSYRGEDPYVFICYAHENAESVYPELVWLRDAGVNVWYDEGIPAGHEWPEELAKGIRGATAMLFFVTPQATFSKHCRSEVSYALNHDVRIVAVHLEPTDLGGGLELQLGHVQALMRHELAEADYRSKVLDALDLSAVVGTPAPQPLSSRPKAARVRISAVVTFVATLAIVAIIFFVLRSPSTEEAVTQRVAATPNISVTSTPSTETSVRDGITQIGEPSLPVRLTARPPARSLTDAAISPDGKYLAFVAFGKVFLQTIATGEEHEVQLDWNGQPTRVAWSSDGTRLFLFGSKKRGLWSVSQFGGKPRLIDEAAERAAESPDGKYLAVIRPDELGRARARVWVMASDGTNARQLLAPKGDDSFWRIAWTPDSKRIALGIWSSTSVQIDTVALDGDDRSTLLASPELFQDWIGVLPFTWCGDGRLVFARRDGPPHQVTSNVWIAETDEFYQALETDPMRLTQSVGSNVRALSADLNCSRVVAMRATNQSDVFIADFTTAGLSNLHQVTFDEREDYATSWTESGNVLLLQSSRAGSWDIYQQRLDQESLLPLAGGEGAQLQPTYVAEGDWVVYLNRHEDPDQTGIRRVPLGGGIPVAVLDGTYGQVQCIPSSTRCIAGAAQGAEYVLTTFDVLTGESSELFRIEHRDPFTNWALSADGTRIAVVHNDNNEVKVIDLESGEERSLIVGGWKWFEHITWAADGMGFVVNARPDWEAFGPGTGAGLIYVDLAGKATLLRRRPNEWDFLPVMSPDGGHLAFSTMKFHANAWMIENP